MASSMGGMFPGQPQQPPGSHPPPPGPGAPGSRAAGNTLVDDLEASFEACFASLVSQDYVNGTDQEEIRTGVDQCIQKFLDVARQTECFFLQKRLQLSVQKPEQVEKEDISELRNELQRKEMLIQKHLAKIHHWQQPKVVKGKNAVEKKVIHPYSRKAASLARAAHKQGRKDKLKNEKAQRLNLIGEKLLWFQSQLDSDKLEYSKQEACEIIERYLHRFDAELEQIELANSIKGRQGRLHFSREAIIKQTMERERAQYDGNGFGRDPRYNQQQAFEDVQPQARN
ncbi:mediator of RNA polymerase II transcription subunit 28 [Clarias magur]|uniref:Mediator of RNA polymerase II transcription subunit 28 n=1 Tax=Clarias magur TaxID=1594786 RepID=A0A8J4XCH8_CLAMG|nr:mediator of RNA polymerase II transcription subunit 28 [Clarias magur]